MTRVFLLAALLAATLAAAPLTAQQTFIAAPSASELRSAAAGDVLVVDIRHPEEWQQTGVLPEALLLTFDTPGAFLAALAPHLDGRPVALICRSGNRTAQAAAMLEGALEVPVIDLAGGMLRLMAEGYAPAPPTAAQGCATC